VDGENQASHQGVQGFEKKIPKSHGVNSDGEKQNWRARRKAHEKRVKQRGDNFDSDSLDSEESQATLLDELEQVQSELLLAKNELNVGESSLWISQLGHLDGLSDMHTLWFIESI
jgi:hypothetical protein